MLPDLAIRYSPFDEPLRFTGVDAAPWAGYCMAPQQQRMLLLPDTLRYSTRLDLLCDLAGEVLALVGLILRCLKRMRECCRHCVVDLQRAKGGFEGHAAGSTHSIMIQASCHQAILGRHAGRQACNAMAAARQVPWTQGYPRPSSWGRPQVICYSGKLLCGDARTHSEQNSILDHTAAI